MQRRQTLKIGQKRRRVEEIKYLRSMVQENGIFEREIKRRMRAGWNGWRKVSGIICDRRLPARVNGKV